MGVKLIENEVRSALGMTLKKIESHAADGHWCEMIVHARPGQSGIFAKMTIAPKIEKAYVKTVDLSVKPGDVVKPFTGANTSLGDIFLRFDTREELDEIMGKSDEWLKIEME